MTSKQRAKLRILGGMAATSLLSLAISAVCEAVGPQQTPDPRQAMVKALSASGPHPSLGDEARGFDRFVGAWDCEYTFFAEDGGVICDQQSGDCERLLPSLAKCGVLMDESERPGVGQTNQR